MSGRGEETRHRLLDGALGCLAEHGIAGTSARSVAARAGVNQALVFYHFGSVDELLTAACRHGAEKHVARYRERFAAVGSLAELFELGRTLHAEERAEDSVAVLAQLLAGAQSDPRLVPATAAGLQLWIDEIETVLRRVLAGSPVEEVVDVPGLAAAVATSFVGLELYDGVDPVGSENALAAIGQLAEVATLLEEQRPLVRSLVKVGLRRGRRRAAALTRRV